MLQGHRLHDTIRKEYATSLHTQMKHKDALRASPLQNSGQQGNVLRLWLEVQRRRKQHQQRTNDDGRRTVIQLRQAFCDSVVSPIPQLMLYGLLKGGATTWLDAQRSFANRAERTTRNHDSRETATAGYYVNCVRGNTIICQYESTADTGKQH